MKLDFNFGITIFRFLNILLQEARWIGLFWTMKQSIWQKYRKIEQGIKSNIRISGDLEDLCLCSEVRFQQIVCNQLKLSSGYYYEFLFSCIFYTVLGTDFRKSDIRADITEHYDAVICGVACDFTMQQSEKKKKKFVGVELIRFPHKCYHKGTRPKKTLASIVIDTLVEHNIPIVPDVTKLEQLNKRIAKYSY